MPNYDPAHLRDARCRASVSQAVVARYAGVSVGHISRVERGERPATPAVIRGYEQALGNCLVSLPARTDGDTLMVNRIGEDADDMKRRAFTAAIAAIAAGGPLTDPITRSLAALGDTAIPAHVGTADVIQVEQAEQMFTTWDLRFGGGLATEMAKTQLRWATSLLDAQMNQTTRRQLHAAVGSLAERAAWSAFDSGRQDAARTLFKLAIHAASEADDANLSAHILSDIATQHLYLGHPDEAIRLLRLAEGDERISPAVRFVLHEVKARAFGTLGDAVNCSRYIGLAEHAYAGVAPETTPEWMSKFLCDAHVYSVTGQAAYALSRATGTFSLDAHQRLSAAIAGFGDGRARAIALCATRLATLHMDAGHTTDGTAAARTALRAVPGLRSARITRDLADVRAAARQHPDTDALSHDINLAMTGVA